MVAAALLSFMLPVLPYRSGGDYVPFPPESLQVDLPSLFHNDSDRRPPGGPAERYRHLLPQGDQRQRYHLYGGGRTVRLLQEYLDGIRTRADHVLLE